MMFKLLDLIKIGLYNVNCKYNYLYLFSYYILLLNRPNGKEISVHYNFAEKISIGTIITIKYLNKDGI